MILMNQPELESRLLPCTAINSVPIVAKLSAFGTDSELYLYTNISVQELMSKFASLTGMAPESLKAKLVEETQTRRLDTQVYVKETLT